MVFYQDFSLTTATVVEWMVYIKQSFQYRFLWGPWYPIFKIRVLDKSVLRILFSLYFGLRWGRMFPKLAVIIIFQEVPLADSADKQVPKSLIIPILKMWILGKQQRRSCHPSRSFRQSCYQVGRLLRYFPQAHWAIHLLLRRHISHCFLEVIICSIHDVNFRFLLVCLQM